jgi:hypothetical protein
MKKEKWNSVRCVSCYCVGTFLVSFSPMAAAAAAAVSSSQDQHEDQDEFGPQQISKLQVL